MPIGDRIRNLRLMKKLTLEEVGEAIGVTKQTLYKYEHSIVTNIPSDKIEQLARIFEVSPSYIMGWDSEHENSFSKYETFNNLTIGERIQKRRKELGISVDEIADELGVDKSTIYRYESEDIEKIPTNILEPLAKILKVTPAYLMGWSNGKTSENQDAAHDLKKLLENAEIMFDGQPMNESERQSVLRVVEELIKLTKDKKRD